MTSDLFVSVELCCSALAGMLFGYATRQGPPEL